MAAPAAGRLPAGVTWVNCGRSFGAGGMPLRGDAAGAGGRGREAVEAHGAAPPAAVRLLGAAAVVARGKDGAHPRE